MDLSIRHFKANGVRQIVPFLVSAVCWWFDIQWASGLAFGMGISGVVWGAVLERYREVLKNMGG